MAGSAIAQASPSTEPDGAGVKRFGDFLIRPIQDSFYGPGPNYSIAFRSQEYWPFGAHVIKGVRPIKALSEGQPMLMAFTSRFNGVGTLLISVQNGTPLSRMLSPVQDERFPDWGVAQPGREELLLFAESGRALDTRTGEVLWFDTAVKGSGYRVVGDLMSVSPDNKLAAYLRFKEILLAGREDGLAAAYQLPLDANVGELADIGRTAYAQSAQALKSGVPNISQRRLVNNMQIAWFASRFQWQSKNDTWELVGRGLGPALPLSER